MHRRSHRGYLSISRVGQRVQASALGMPTSQRSTDWRVRRRRGRCEWSDQPHNTLQRGRELCTRLEQRWVRGLLDRGCSVLEGSKRWDRSRLAATGYLGGRCVARVAARASRAVRPLSPNLYRSMRRASDTVRLDRGIVVSQGPCLGEVQQLLYAIGQDASTSSSCRFAQLPVLARSGPFLAFAGAPDRSYV